MILLCLPGRLVGTYPSVCFIRLIDDHSHQMVRAGFRVISRVSLTERLHSKEGSNGRTIQTVICMDIGLLSRIFFCFGQEGTDMDDFINSCSITADGNVVLTGSTKADWADTEANSDYFSIVAVKLDVTDGTVLWRYQVLTGTKEAKLLVCCCYC